MPWVQIPLDPLNPKKRSSVDKILDFDYAII